MSALLDRAAVELDAAKDELDSFFPEGILGYAMSQTLVVNEVLWARAAAKALEDWAAAQEQYQEARRVATWNPERGWAPFVRAVRE